MVRSRRVCPPGALRIVMVPELRSCRRPVWQAATSWGVTVIFAGWLFIRARSWARRQCGGWCIRSGFPGASADQICPATAAEARGTSCGGVSPCSLCGMGGSSDSSGAVLVEVSGHRSERMMSLAQGVRCEATIRTTGHTTETTSARITPADNHLTLLRSAKQFLVCRLPVRAGSGILRGGGGPSYVLYDLCVFLHDKRLSGRRAAAPNEHSFL